jgi:hypothetical protein
MTLQLVDGNEVCQKYMTLSYCLEVLPEDSLTMKSNLSHRQSSISFKELTPTFDRRLSRGIRQDGAYLPEQLPADRS